MITEPMQPEMNLAAGIECIHHAKEVCSCTILDLPLKVIAQTKTELYPFAINVAGAQNYCRRRDTSS